MIHHICVDTRHLAQVHHQTSVHLHLHPHHDLTKSDTHDHPRNLLLPPPARLLLHAPPPHSSRLRLPKPLPSMTVNQACREATSTELMFDLCKDAMRDVVSSGYPSNAVDLYHMIWTNPILGAVRVHLSTMLTCQVASKYLSCGTILHLEWIRYCSGLVGIIHITWSHK